MLAILFQSKKYKNFIFVVFFSVYFLSGCTIKNQFDENDYYQKTTNFYRITHQLSIPLCKEIHPGKILYLTDFVNESNLENRSNLGFTLANTLKVNILNKQCTQNNVIKSFELASNLKMGANGSKIFSRKIEELKIKNIEDDKQILVGSYVISSKQLIIYLKLINLKTGNIVGSSMTTTPLTYEIDQLESGFNSTIQKPFHL